MKMRTLLIILLSISNFFILAQEDVNNWLIKGENIGKGIIYRPQDYINKELNFSNLFINAKENSEVIAPRSGIVKSFRYAYYKKLTYSVTFGEPNYNDSLSVAYFDTEFRKTIAEQNNLNPNDISLLLGLETKKGEMYWILGLRPVKFFKTGTKINKGEIIGKVGYSYHQIKQPSILFSRDVQGKPADPMSMFGLKSTFRQSQQETTRNYLTYKHPRVKLAKDFKTFKNALVQGHPGLYDYISKDNLNNLFDKAEAQLTSRMTSEEFRTLLLPILKEIRDSHTVLLSKRYKTTDRAYPPILFGLKNDSLVVYSALPEYKNFLDKKIIGIDGENLLNIIPKVKLLVYGNDGYITSLENRWLLLYFWKFYSQLTSKNNDDEIMIQFNDSSKHTFKYQQKNLEDYYPKFIKDGSDRFSTSTIIPQTALLDINTFTLLEKDIDSIGDFIKKISDSGYLNLIIDVRDNSGGESENIGKIYSFLANKPFRITQLQKVNSNAVFPFLKNSLNLPYDHVLFAEYEQLEGKDGYYLPKEHFPQIAPNKKIHFNKNVYVLINELSRSAATIFPALVYQQKRGLVIGRETGSTYFQLNALKFADIYLENTGLELHIPLVKVVFDKQENIDIPWGRGVLPHHNIPISYDEFLSEKDTILDTALDIIANSTNSDQEKNKFSNFYYIFFGLLITIFIGVLISKMKI